MRKQDVAALCPNTDCGFQNRPEASFCGRCGAELIVAKPKARRRWWTITIAVLSAIILLIMLALCYGDIIRGFLSPSTGRVLSGEDSVDVEDAGGADDAVEGSIKEF